MSCHTGVGYWTMSPNVTWGREGSKISQKNVTYFLNGPLSVNLTFPLMNILSRCTCHIQKLWVCHPFWVVTMSLRKGHVELESDDLATLTDQVIGHQHGQLFLLTILRWFTYFKTFHIWFHICSDHQLQWKPLNVITSGQTKSDRINRMITITDDIYLVIYSK